MQHPADYVGNGSISCTHSLFKALQRTTGQLVGSSAFISSALKKQIDFYSFTVPGASSF